MKTIALIIALFTLAFAAPANAKDYPDVIFIGVTRSPYIQVWIHGHVSETSSLNVFSSMGLYISDPIVGQIYTDPELPLIQTIFAVRVIVPNPSGSTTYRCLFLTQVAPGIFQCPLRVM